MKYLAIALMAATLSFIITRTNVELHHCRALASQVQLEIDHAGRVNGMIAVTAPDEDELQRLVNRCS